ncbi:YcxB family protein [Weissella paramesenteroides]|uniref:YcxB-like C-terminal domain-containing protein n=1 Tax=Weissella paramesenteroides ATCC 33313 TaxID=585506 RepID=C5RBT4_WEIPA|nr:YcxB family protein [Weissella paramesenteroides]ATF41199.1 hypothetical protein CO680_03695 [Weissella paramesenteroides]EER74353.1 hypothetical protein HMPREF0877_1430 [Weissella paramesenteroides ATCC 33313]
MITCQTTIDDKIVYIIYKHYLKTHRQISISNNFVGIAGIFLMLMGFIRVTHTIFFNVTWQFYDFFMLFVFLCGLYFFLSGLFFTPKNNLKKIRNRYLNKNQKSITVEYVFNTEGVQINQSDSKLFYQWPALKQVWDLPDYYILEVNPGRYNLINKEKFRNEDYFEFQNLLKQVLASEQYKKSTH